MSSDPMERPGSQEPIELCADCGQRHVTSHGGRACRAHLSSRRGPGGEKLPCSKSPVKGLPVCASHGVNGRTREAAAARAQRERAERAVQTYGLPREVPAEVALLEEVHRTAGHVDYLQHLVAELDEGDLKQYTRDRGGLTWEKPAVWLEIYQAERKHLVAVTKAALDAGVAERQVRLVEQMAVQLAGVLRGVLAAAEARLCDVVPASAVPAVREVFAAEVPGIARRHLLGVGVGDGRDDNGGGHP